ncbi:hypothetical protein [uncultured Castellaniella sp.]|uniref:hypothetical protein n=1 Tax=uncultured Castellaniella sp. TaxID=647907 RepID=UPI002632C835|nr:hypothetical protein [uncultured Castellaniella sp.]
MVSPEGWNWVQQHFLGGNDSVQHAEVCANNSNQPEAVINDCFWLRIQPVDATY